MRIVNRILFNKKYLEDKKNLFTRIGSFCCKYRGLSFIIGLILYIRALDRLVLHINSVTFHISSSCLPFSICCLKIYSAEISFSFAQNGRRSLLISITKMVCAFIYMKTYRSVVFILGFHVQSTGCSFRNILMKIVAPWTHPINNEFASDYFYTPFLLRVFLL